VDSVPAAGSRTSVLFRNVTCLFGCCLTSVSMVALSSGRMLTAAGILICSTSHAGSRDYNIGECESQLTGFYFTLVLLPAAGTLSTTFFLNSTRHIERIRGVIFAMMRYINGHLHLHLHLLDHSVPESKHYTAHRPTSSFSPLPLSITPSF